MTQIKKLKNSQGVQVYPQTHTKAVIDDNGYTAESRLGAMQDEINNLQEGVVVVGEGMTPVPSDLTPTEGSSNWVTSGGVYNSIQVVQSELTELEGELSGASTQVNLASYPDVMFTIDTNGVWATTSNANHSIFVPMQDGEYKLTASTSTQALYTVLTSNATPTTGATPAYATGYTDRISIPAGETVTVQGTAGLYLWMRNDASTSGAMPPTVMFSSGNSRIDDIEIGLGQLEGKWQVQTDDAPAILTFTNSKASGYMLVQSGALRSSEGSVVCDYYDISGLVGKTIKVTCSVWVSTNVNYDSAVLTYNSSKTKVRAFTGRTLAGTTTSGTYVVYDYEITVQSDEAYIRICSNNSSIISLKHEALVEYDASMLAAGKTAVGTSYDNTNSAIVSTNAQGALDEIASGCFTDVNASLTFTSENASGYIMRPSGDFVASAGYVTCDYYYIGDLVGKVIKVTTAAWVSSSGQYDNAVIVYNASKNISRAFRGRTLAGSTSSAVYTIEDYEITVQSGEAYIRINSARSAIIGLKYEGLVNEKVNELSNEIENIKGSIQAIPDLVESYEYTGKKVEIEKHRFGGELYMSFSATGTVQGGANYDNYYVISSYDSSHNIILTIYDLSTKTSLGSVNLGIMPISSTHANTVVFSNQFHTEGDTLPVLYICSGYGSETTSQVYAYRLVNTGSEWTATLIQTITLSSNATISWAEFVPDNENSVCWIKTDAWYRTSLPLITAGDVTIDMTSLTAVFSSPSYTGSGQGHLFYDGKIYFPSNISGGPWHLNVLDTVSGELVNVINIGQFYANEPEHCFIYDDHLYVGYQGKRVYKLYFD